MIDDQDEPDFSDLFREKDLWSIYLAAPSFLANPFNRLVSIAVFVALSSFSVWRVVARPGVQISFTDIFMNWASLGWTLTSSLLGFLIAGFALLCTVFRPATVLHLHSITLRGEQNNALRNLFIFFVDIFVNFLCFMSFCVGMTMVASKGGPVVEIRQVLSSFNPRLPMIAGYLVFVLWGSWFSVLLLKLKSFVYNLYQSLLFGMVHAVHFPEE